LPRLSGNPWVVPGAKPGTHMTDIYTAWRTIRAKAGLHDVRIHDIRHSCAAYPLNPPFFLALFSRHKFRNQIVTGFDHIPDVACRACFTIPAIFESQVRTCAKAFGASPFAFTAPSS